MTEESPGRRPRKNQPSRLAKAVRLERDRRGWTSEVLAEKAGLSHSWVRNMEAGIIAEPGWEKIEAMERAMSMRPGELYVAAIGVPYERLVNELLADSTDRKVPWDDLLAGQAEILKALRALSRRISPSSAIVDEEAVQEHVGHAVEQGIRQGRRRANLPPVSDGA